MSSQLRHQVAAVFDDELVPSPQIQEWVFQETKSRGPKRSPYPRLAAAGAALLVVASAGYYAYRYGIPGITPAEPVPAAQPDGANLSVGTFFSGESGWIVRRGSKEELFQTTDGGRTWHARLELKGEYDGMAFSADGGRGVVWTGGVSPAPSCSVPCTTTAPPSWFYRTKDSGVSWQQLALPAGNFVSASFLDPDHGWVLMGPGQGGPNPATVYATSDGGTSWKQLGQIRFDYWNGYGFEFGTYERSFQFADGLQGWFVPSSYNSPSTPALVGTADGGTLWHGVVLNLPDGMGGEISAAQPVLFGDGTGVLPVEVRSTQVNPNGAEPPSQVLIFSTSDNGATWGLPRPLFPTWSPQASTRLVGMMGIWDFLDANHWYVMNQTGTGGGPWAPRPELFVTADGGITWTTYSNAPNISDIHFTDPRHGWAEDQTHVDGIGNVNGLIRTSDGGRTWTRVTLPRI